jgi:hypothetical protein
VQCWVCVTASDRDRAGLPAVFLGRRVRPFPFARWILNCRGLVIVAALLSACASAPPPQRLGPVDGPLAAWSPRLLPGKQATDYSWGQRGGLPCVKAQARGSVSLWRRSLSLDPSDIAALQFDWWIARQSATASVTDAQTDDASARLVLGFDGDESRLSGRNRMQFELVRTLTGEAPPFATLIYAWDARAPLDTLVVSSRSDRVRKIVVGSGAAGEGRWQRIVRDVRADFERAYGEPPGRLVSMALMTDGDNTASQTEACYGDILITGRAGALLDGSLQLQRQP